MPWIKPVFAHCDGPCGHYETDTLRNSALTCQKLATKLLALEAGSQAYIRLTMLKEEHAQICKQQVYILWSDYFKPHHYEQYPKLANQLYCLAQQCSQVKQSLDLVAVATLLTQIKALEAVFSQTQTLN